LEEVSNSMVEADQQRIAKALEDFCEGRMESYHEISRVKIGHLGDYYWTESYATVSARDAEGKPKSIVGTSMRIDERKAMESALVEARNKAEESDRLKSAFIANMSHEIRTPLNAIIGFTSVLPDVQGEDERRELINLIQENNQKLLTIIDDVMNISKIESGKEPLVMSTFELNEILNSVADGFVPKLAEGVKLSTMFAQGALNVTTDLNRLMEVLTHLLANAVKFTQQGSIIVGYDAPQGKRMRIWIRDTGKGIAPEHQERIFERFFKVDEYIPGAGLGLSICRTMAYSMGGSIGVESKLGEGSTFWFELPI
jgi:signal transduction histidine kinase